MFELSYEEKQAVLIQLQHSCEWLEWQHAIYPNDKNIENEYVSITAQIINLKNSLS